MSGMLSEDERCEMHLGNPGERTMDELRQACWWGTKRIAVLQVRVAAYKQQRWLTFIVGMGAGALWVLLFVGLEYLT